MKRVFITMTLAIDLDQVPGAYHQPQDYVTMLENQLRGAKHYHPELTVHRIEEKSYTHNPKWQPGVEGEAYWIRPQPSEA